MRTVDEQTTGARVDRVSNALPVNLEGGRSEWNMDSSATGQPAESVDIFPTLAELAGLPAPKGPQPVDGKSLVPVLRDPSARVRDHAFHAYPKSRMGRAIRTERYRLVEWTGGKNNGPAEFELYDYEKDPDETKNLVESLPEVARKLKAVLARYPAPAKRR